MKGFDKCNDFEQAGIIKALKDDGWSQCRYEPEGAPGMSKKKIGFMFKDLIIEE